MTNCNYSEHAKIQRKEIQKQIEKLQAKLEELENQKPPIEEAFKRVFGVYPYPCTAWEWFQKGYNAAEEDVRDEEPEDTVWKNAALKFGEKLASIGPCGYYEFSSDEWFEWAVNTYEKLADDWLILLNKEKRVKKLQEKEWTCKVTDEKGETNPYKQHLNPKKSNNLYDVIADWWDEIFVNGNPSGQNIESLVEQIEKWFPKRIDETCGLSENDVDWNNGYNTYREYLVKKLK